MIDLVLIGGGGHCKSCIDVIENTKKYQIIGILDTELAVGSRLLGYEVLGDDSIIQILAKKRVEFLITIGQIESHKLRKKIYNKVKQYGGIFATIISPRSYVSPHSKVKEGTIIMHDVLINAAVTINENCIINTKALIEHDSVVEAHCHISTAAVINGNCKVLEGTFFGSNAVSKQGVTTNNSGFVKAGSCFLGREL